MDTEQPYENRKEERKNKHYLLDRTGKEIVYNVYNYFKKTLNISVSAAVAKASEATRVSDRGIYNIKKEFEKNGFASLEKQDKVTREPIEAMIVCDEFTKYGVRKLVYNFFAQNIAPTLNIIHSAIKGDETLQKMSRTTLHSLLKNIGFNYETIDNKQMLVERDDIVAWRHNYLRKIRKYREEGRPIVYTDESWVSIERPELQNPIPTDVSASSTNSELSEKVRKSKIRAGVTRFVLVHAGNEEGFINGAEYHFLCKKKRIDPLFEIEPDKYEAWFQEKLLPNTPNGCVIVLDTASYHTRRIDKLSNCKSNDKKEKNVGESTPRNKRRKLSDESSIKTKQESQRKKSENILTPKYRIDELAEISGKIILRLPPYHFELNAMELVWNKVRQIIAEDRCSIVEAYEKITSNDWHDFVNQVKRNELEIWIMENVQEEMREHTNNVQQ